MNNKKRLSVRLIQKLSTIRFRANTITKRKIYVIEGNFIRELDSALPPTDRKSTHEDETLTHLYNQGILFGKKLHMTVLRITSNGRCGQSFPFPWLLLQVNHTIKKLHKFHRFSRSLVWRNYFSVSALQFLAFSDYPVRNILD